MFTAIFHSLVSEEDYKYISTIKILIDFILNNKK